MAGLMRIVPVLLLGCFSVLGTAEPQYDFTTFSEKIMGECLMNLWSEQGPQNTMHPTGNTMESFIAMVEKVEARHEDWDIFQVSRALLKRFAFEEIAFKQTGPERQLDFKGRWDTMAKLLGDDTDSKTFDEDDLNEVEKCTMFFMMGHCMNNTFRSTELDGDASRSQVNINDMDHEAPAAPPVQVATQPREQGVLSIRGHGGQAIAISKVLNAILTTENIVGDPLVRELYNTKQEGIPRDLKINPLLGVTLGDIISTAAINHDFNQEGKRFFGPSGYWNASDCPMEYKLDSDDTTVTVAQLVGAIDGAFIGQAVGELGKGEESVRLSRILRMYYSSKGIPSTTAIQESLSYCRREIVLDHFSRSAVHDSVLAFAYAFMDNAKGKLLQPPEIINKALDKLILALDQMKREDATDECRNQGASDQPTCETPNNVFVVLDTSELQSNGFRAQETIVGYLASRLDFGRGVGSINVYFDSKGDRRTLRVVTENNTDPTCAACEVARIDRQHEAFSSRATSEVVLLDGLNKTLQDFESKYDLEPGVPNKVAVMFHYERLKETNEKRLTGARNILRDGHRDTRLIVVSSENIDKASLSVLAEGTDDIVTKREPEDVANELAKRICKVPAVFQFNRCYDHKKGSRNEDQNVYTGYVTDNHVQFWAFYPEYFLKSYLVKIKFEVENGDMIVCEKRGVENPGYKGDTFNKDECQTTDSNKRVLEFSFRNPCEGHHVHNCPPINFAIVGDGKTRTKTDCPANDDKCRRLDQIKFKMSHEGVFCSGCEFLRSSYLLTLLVAMATFLARRF